MSSTPLLLIAALTATALAGDATKPDPSSSNESDATKVSNLAKQFGDSSQAAANCNTVAGKKEKCKNLCPDLTLAIKCAVEESGKDFRAADKTSAAGGAAKVELKDALLAKIANSGKQADKDVVDSKEDANKRCDERESKFTGLKKTVDDAADKFQSSASTPAEREAATKVIKDAAADPDKWHIKNRVLKAKRADVVAKQIEKTVAKEGKDSKARVICAKVKIDGSKLDTLRTKAKEINVDSDANTSDFFDVVDAGKGNDDSFDGTSFKPTKPNCRPKPKCVKPIVKPSPNDPTKPVPGGGEKPPAGPSTDPNKPPTGGDKPVVKPPVNAPPPPPSGDQKPPVNSPPSGDQKPPVNPPPSGDQKPPVNPPPSGEQKPPTGDVPKPAPAPVDPPKPSTGDAPKPAPAPVDPPKPPTGDAPKPDPSAPVPAPAPGSDPNKVPAPVPGGFNQVPAPAKPPGQDAGSGAGEKPPADGNSGSGKAPEGSNSGSGGDPAKPGSGSGEKPDGSGSGEKPDGSGSEPGKPGSGEKPDGSGSGEKPDGSGEKPGSGEGHHGDDTTDDEDCQEVPADSKEKGTLKKRHDSHDDEDCNEVSDEDKTEDKTEDKDEDKDEDEEKDEDEKADHDRDPATPSKVPTKRQAAKVSCDVFVPTTAANADLTSVQVAAMLGDLDADVESVDIVGEEDVEIVKAVVVKSPVDSVGGAATQVLAASAVLSAAVARLFW